MKCRYCGYENEPGVKFCASCETPMVYPLGYKPEDEAAAKGELAPEVPKAEGKPAEEIVEEKPEAKPVEEVAEEKPEEPEEKIEAADAYKKEKPVDKRKNTKATIRNRRRRRKPRKRKNPRRNRKRRRKKRRLPKRRKRRRKKHLLKRLKRSRKESPSPRKAASARSLR